MMLSDDIIDFVNSFNIPSECIKRFYCDLDSLKIRLADDSDIIICKNNKELTFEEFNYYFTLFNDRLNNKLKNYYNSIKFINLYNLILNSNDLNSISDTDLILSFNSFYYLKDSNPIFKNDYFYEIIHSELNNRKKGEFCAV